MKFTQDHYECHEVGVSCRKTLGTLARNSLEVTKPSRDAEYRVGATYRIIGQTEVCDRRVFNKRINRRATTFYLHVRYRLLFRYVFPFLLSILPPGGLN